MLHLKMFYLKRLIRKKFHGHPIDAIELGHNTKKIRFFFMTQLDSIKRITKKIEEQKKTQKEKKEFDVYFFLSIIVL